MMATTKYPFQMTAAEQEAEIAQRAASLVELRAWRDAAIADGWKIAPTYDHEPVERACHLMREGFVVSMLLREPRNGERWPVVSISAWCPKGISLDFALRTTYDWPSLIAATRTCPVCGTKDVDTVRVGFANRSCAACRPAVAAKIEVGNWTE